MAGPSLSADEINALRRVAYGLGSFLPSASRVRLSTLGLVAVNGRGRLVLARAGRVHLARVGNAQNSQPSRPQRSEGSRAPHGAVFFSALVQVGRVSIKLLSIVRQPGGIVGNR